MSTKYTFEELAAAAASSQSTERLGAMEVGGTQAHIGRLLRRHEIDISHFESLQRQRRRLIEDVSPAEFAEAIGQARSIAQVSRILGVVDNTTFRRRYRYQVMKQGLDVSHLMGQAHARGTRSPRRSGPTELLTVAPGAARRLSARRLRSATIEVGCPNCHATTPTFCRRKRQEPGPWTSRMTTR